MLKHLIEGQMVHRVKCMLNANVRDGVESGHNDRMDEHLLLGVSQAARIDRNGRLAVVPRTLAKPSCACAALFNLPRIIVPKATGGARSCGLSMLLQGVPSRSTLDSASTGFRGSSTAGIVSWASCRLGPAPSEYYAPISVIVRRSHATRKRTLLQLVRGSLLPTI